jgi:hypothetical protein
MEPHDPSVVVAESQSGHDRMADAIRQVGHVAREARLLKTVAEDAVADGLHAAKRTVRRARHNLEDMRDTAVSLVRRDPFKTGALLFGAGFLLGAVSGFAIRKRGPRSRLASSETGHALSKPH